MKLAKKIKRRLKRFAFRKIRRIVTVYIEFRIFKSILRRIRKKL